MPVLYCHPSLPWESTSGGNLDGRNSESVCELLSHHADHGKGALKEIGNNWMPTSLFLFAAVDGLALRTSGASTFTFNVDVNRISRTCLSILFASLQWPPCNWSR